MPSLPTKNFGRGAREGSLTLVLSSQQGQYGAQPTIVAKRELELFVDLVPRKQIVLAAARVAGPGSSITGVLVPEDSCATWMSNLDSSGVFQLTIDSQGETVIEFKISLYAPGTDSLTFSSNRDVVAQSFSCTSETIPASGLFSGGRILCCGLDARANPEVKVESTIGDLFSFVNLRGMIEYLPQAIVGLGVTLDMNTTAGQRNAFWFEPELNKRTTVRLCYQLNIDVAENFGKAILGSLSNNLTIATPKIICKRIMLSAVSEGQWVPVERGSVSVELKCSIAPGNMPAVEAIAVVGFHETGLDITFQLHKSNDLASLWEWLDGLASGTSDHVKDLLQKDNILHNVHFRQVKLSLSTVEGGNLPSLESFVVDIEASATFSQDGLDQGHPVFLLSYSWSKGCGGMIRGELWNWFDSSSNDIFAPSYEEWSDLRPVTANPARTIDLAALIPNQKVPHIPSYLPHELSNAYLVLTSRGFSIGAMVECKSGPNNGRVPSLDLGMVRLDASYLWGAASSFRIRGQTLVRLKPSPSSKYRHYATLMCSLEYNSRSWSLVGTLRELHGSNLYELLDPASAQHVMPLIESIEIASAELSYQYAPANPEDSKSRSTESSFRLTGSMFIASLEFSLDFKHGDDWEFAASLNPTQRRATVTLGQILTEFLHVSQDELDVPEFVCNTQFTSNEDSATIAMHRSKAGSNGDGTGSFQLTAQIVVGPISLTFAQHRSASWGPEAPSKRIVRVAFSMPDIDIPGVGQFKQPFELCFVWVQDTTNPSWGSASTRDESPSPRGLTRGDIAALNNCLGDAFKLVPKHELKASTQDSDILLSAGSHFMVIFWDGAGRSRCALDYHFGKQRGMGDPTAAAQAHPPTQRGRAQGTPTVGEEGSTSGGTMATAPFKLTSGPISISNVGLKYASKKVHLMLDATFVLGPVGVSLVGFEIIQELPNLKDLRSPTFGLQGLAPVLVQPPLTIAGLVKHESVGGRSSYTGGLIVGMEPYLFQAAGFYGQHIPGSDNPFDSLFVFAKLDGPLVTLAFGTISGFTAGFGYNSSMRFPTASELAESPFAPTSKLFADIGSNPSAVLQRLASLGGGGWCQPLQDHYWAMAGIRVDSFNMLSLDVIFSVQFGPTVKLGVMAVGTADFPNTGSPQKFARAELAFAGVVDLDHGTFQAEAQLSPASFILHKDCHLTGGFALYYWFDAPHARADRVDTFVYTMGGYHPAFLVPEDYPKPARLRISWAVNEYMSITGLSYFAITPKACMGGGRLHVTYSAGPVSVWFDASADFLIDYKPFHFNGSVKVHVGAQIDVSGIWQQIRLSASADAELYLWGPPLAGRVHLQFWVKSVDICFGDPPVTPPAVSLLDFYKLVLQPGTHPGVNTGSPRPPNEYTRPTNEAHVFRVESGLLSQCKDTDSNSSGHWVVRGGKFVFSVGCTMPISIVQRGSDRRGSDRSNECIVDRIDYPDNEIHCKPMKGKSPVMSRLDITITNRNNYTAAGPDPWRMEKIVRAYPTGLWGKYDANESPSAVLRNSDHSVKLLGGVRLTAPPPRKSADLLPKFKSRDLGILEIKAAIPASLESTSQFAPAESTGQSNSAWDNAVEGWRSPRNEGGKAGREGFVEGWAKAFEWDASIKSLAALPPGLEKRFWNIYKAAPTITRGVGGSKKPRRP